jgi:hypothetical protein
MIVRELFMGQILKEVDGAYGGPGEYDYFATSTTVAIDQEKALVL